jgi:hypothetical protein
MQVTPVSQPKQVKTGQQVIITITISQFLQTQAVFQRTWLFASSGVNGVCTAVPYVEGSEKRFSLCCPGDRRVVGGIGPYI